MTDHLIAFAVALFVNIILDVVNVLPPCLPVLALLAQQLFRLVFK